MFLGAGDEDIWEAKLDQYLARIQWRDDEYARQWAMRLEEAWSYYLLTFLRHAILKLRWTNQWLLLKADKWSQTVSCAGFKMSFWSPLWMHALSSFTITCLTSLNPSQSAFYLLEDSARATHMATSHILSSEIYKLKPTALWYQSVQHKLSYTDAISGEMLYNKHSIFNSLANEYAAHQLYPVRNQPSQALHCNKKNAYLHSIY